MYDVIWANLHITLERRTICHHAATKFALRLGDIVAAVHMCAFLLLAIGDRTKKGEQVLCTHSEQKCVSLPSRLKLPFQRALLQVFV